jgi:predicted regulator of Ras-like GTPase activity (Roadblock/LC7/MglB family)
MRIIDQLMQIEGLLGCCVVDAETGLVMGQERIGDEEINLELIAASNTEVLKAHRRASRDMGCGDRVDEVIVTHGRRHQVLRTVASHPDLFVLAVLDKQRTNLALARFKIMDAEKALG